MAGTWHGLLLLRCFPDVGHLFQGFGDGGSSRFFDASSCEKVDANLSGPTIGWVVAINGSDGSACASAGWAHGPMGVVVPAVLLPTASRIKGARLERSD